MIGRKIFLLAFGCSVATISVGQDKKKDQSTSIESALPQKEYTPPVKKKKKNKGAETTYSARDDFYDRQEALSKQSLKNEKESEKPQYSDQKYFGHKRPPKRRSPDKMKFCKVCGIRH